MDNPILFAGLQPMKGSAGVTPLSITPAAFDRRFNTGRNVLEPKFDGFRVLVHKAGELVEHDLLKEFPDYILEAFRGMPDGIYDGELYVPGGFSWDAGRKKARKVFMLFDIIVLQDRDLTDVAYRHRRSLLEVVIKHHTGDLIRLTPQLPCVWASVQAIFAEGGEGAMVKALDSPYERGHRSKHWVKVKNIEQHVVTINGFKSGSYGPCARVQYVFDDGVAGSFKNKNHEWIRMMEQNPSAFIGRKLIVECQLRNAKGKARHAMVKRFAPDHMLGTEEVVG
jgi:hypothetical protein